MEVNQKQERDCAKICGSFIIIFIITESFGEDAITTLVAKLLGILMGMISNYLGYKFVFK